MTGVNKRALPERSEVINLRCIDDCRENESNFGAQLWYFDGYGVDEMDRRSPIYGVVEYSIQFGLNELVEDGVFDSNNERERAHRVFHREQLGPAWRGPVDRWLAVGLVTVCIAAVGLLLKSLTL